ncbi:MAG TPA: hypothetical protein PLG23_17040 [Thermoflexales bacterium]|jgi:hypothetical protein|nr:hypothetical protein [Thermoflexales bacterium]HQX10264.1 hypothetical protein [Thermoflexales bacterium]HQY23911.1 hypothetical protein [Thermoflexales bacterium]HQZ55173.1 hypothetical protein [Thermoflexales bacterium]HRA55291.1 hypothetical protein [Thermoflexales bacterium]
MSKKPRRYRTPNLPTSAYGSVGGAGSAPATAVTAPVQRAPVAQVISKNWQDEYTEVLGDLKKTGIIAVILLAGMAVLSFVLR